MARGDGAPTRRLLHLWTFQSIQMHLSITTENLLWIEIRGIRSVMTSIEKGEGRVDRQRGERRSPTTRDPNNRSNTLLIPEIYTNNILHIGIKSTRTFLDAKHRGRHNPTDDATNAQKVLVRRHPHSSIQVARYLSSRCIITFHSFDISHYHTKKLYTHIRQYIRLPPSLPRHPRYLNANIWCN
jgi:hypothetical protein